jgi:hypothetical protein
MHDGDTFLGAGFVQEEIRCSSILRWCDVCFFVCDMQYTEITCMPQMAILALGYVRK